MGKNIINIISNRIVLFFCLLILVLNTNLLFAQDSTDDVSSDSILMLIESLQYFEETDDKLIELSSSSKRIAGKVGSSNNKSSESWSVIKTSLEEAYKKNAMLLLKLRDKENEIKDLESDIKVMNLQVHYYTVAIIILGILSSIFVLLLLLISFGKQFPDLVDIIKAAIKKIIKLS
ncbi:MAG: hypothetical protein IKQ61_01510 [Spirochaetales bacterium]|nr:hypothetical protein [Spirochaetales bacterium]